MIAPDDAGYDDARELFIPAFDNTRPAVIVQVADAGDVATVLATVRETGVELAVNLFPLNQNIPPAAG